MRRLALMSIALACLVACVSATEPRYKPVGHLSRNIGGRVTVNGQEVTNVIELNDVEGWVVHIPPCNITPPPGTDWVAPVCRVAPDTVYGAVRVEWDY